MNDSHAASGSSLLSWNLTGRLLVFALSSTSIWCLLAEFYGLCSMRVFTLTILLPSTAALVAVAAFDAFRGNGRLARAVVIGGTAGFVAACAYDVFRLPFVFSESWHLSAVVPSMNLFKVFPRFGAMILNEPIEQPAYSLAAHLVGWTYHFSNGITFGVMYLAMLGDATRRSWWWAVAMAAGLELAMLFTPYTQFFGIHLTTRFVIITLVAHIVFGMVLGLLTRRLADRQPTTAALA